MKQQAGGIGDYSSSPTGQGCLWVAAVGVILVLTLSYVGAYSGGTVRDPLDHVENGIAGATRPISLHRSRGVHTHRRIRRHRVVYHADE